MPDFDRRRQILEAAERLLYRYGPTKTTMAEVAREAEIGVGTVYLEFSSKDDLIEELSMSSHRKVLDAMRTAARRNGAPFQERLQACLEIRVDAFLRLADAGAHACDLFHCVSPAVESAQARFREDERSLIADLLREGMQAGEFVGGDPDEIAGTLLLAYMSFSPPWVYRQSQEDARKALRSMHRLILQGLKYRRGGG